MFKNVLSKLNNLKAKASAWVWVALMTLWATVSWWTVALEPADITVFTDWIGALASSLLWIVIQLAPIALPMIAVWFVIKYVSWIFKRKS